MAIYEVESESIKPIPEAHFAKLGLKERGDLQRLIRDRIEVVAPDTMVLAEEFGNWEDSRRRIDLLALDREANLVVIELKRNEDGGFMDLQAIRYAGMITGMTFDQAVAAHQAYRTARGIEGDAQETILEFLGWGEPDEDAFAGDVRLVLVSAEFSKELTSAVMFLNERELDIRCVRVKPYSLEDRVLVDVQQVLPLPEASDYVVKLREKAREERRKQRSSKDLTKFDVTIVDETEAHLPKRRAIFRVVRHLCDRGITPEEISKLLDRPHHRTWREAPGELDSEEFTEAATEAARAGGPVFDPRRWWVEDDELIVSAGTTYAFTKMWGLNTEEAIKSMLKAFPHLEISVRRSGEEGEAG
jgi:hypothetical protein